MGRSIRTLILGAALIVAAIAGLIIVPQHAPEFIPGFAGTPTALGHEGKYNRCVAAGGSSEHCVYVAEGVTTRSSHVGFSRTSYDLLLIVSWALAVLGVIAVLVGLIYVWGAARRSGQPA